MAKVNFLQVNGTPWGTVVSALIRSWAGANAAKGDAGNLSFDSLDIRIVLNGEEVSPEVMQTFIALLNKSVDSTNASQVRSSFSDLLTRVSNSMENNSPQAMYQRALDQVYDRLSSVDLNHLIEDISSCEESGDFQDTLDCVQERIRDL